MLIDIEIQGEKANLTIRVKEDTNGSQGPG